MRFSSPLNKSFGPIWRKKGNVIWSGSQSSNTSTSNKYGSKGTYRLIKQEERSKGIVSSFCRRRCISTLLWKGYFKYFKCVFSNTDHLSRLVFYMYLYQPIETEFFTNRSTFAKEKDWALVFVFKFNSQLYVIEGWKVCIIIDVTCFCW